MKNKNQNKKQGFTIAELILVIGIIGILAAIGTGSYFDQRRHFVFNDSLSRTVSFIKTAREYAITSRAAFINNASIIPPDGYGVHIKLNENAGTSRLTLFANTGRLIRQFDEGDFVEETYTFPKETNFEALLKDYKNSPPMPEKEAVIIFRPPFAETFISNNGDPESPVNLINTLYLRFSNRFSPSSAPKRFISINKTAGFPELEL